MLIGSDGLSSKSAWIGVGFRLFLSDSESDYFFIRFKSNNFVSDRIGFVSNSDYTAIPTQWNKRKKVNINHTLTPKTTDVGQKEMGKQWASECHYTQQSTTNGIQTSEDKIWPKQGLDT